jgi:hypothetical protein
MSEPAPYELATNEFLSQHRLMVASFNKSTIFEENSHKIIYPAQSKAILPWRAIDKKDVDNLQKKGVINITPIDETFNRYKVGEQAFPLFTHIGGGVGDIIVFSAITAFLSDHRIIVHTEEKFRPIFEWFRYPVMFKNWHSTIVENHTPANRITRYKNLKRLPLEWSAIQSHDTNWYDGFFQRIGLEKAQEGYDRPILNTNRISHLPQLIKKNSILICHRASCQMRSSHFEDFYPAVREAFPNKTIYVHDVDLTESDQYFIANQMVRRRNIVILPQCTMGQFLTNLYDADMVVTTDSSAIHFREGLEKPCLGVFGAMTIQSRASTYSFTRSFNTESPCPHQPCFIHELRKGQVCPNATEGDRVARCQSGPEFQLQLYRELKKL